MAVLDGWIAESDAALELGVKVATLRNWRSAERGPPWSKRNGRAVVYAVAGLRKWIEAQTVCYQTPGTLSAGRRRAR